MELCREVKPVVVSMGGVAASGGYYISAPADVILADRTTQTGSIGVFGMKLNLEKTLRDKVGITVDVAKTNAYADMGSVARPLMPAERAFLQGQVALGCCRCCRRIYRICTLYRKHNEEIEHQAKCRQNCESCRKPA